jgi:hypothetical protein
VQEAVAAADRLSIVNESYRTNASGLDAVQQHFRGMAAKIMAP